MIRSLRGRLVVGLVLLVIVGLAISSVATYVALQSFLLQRVDDQLLTGRDSAARYLLDLRSGAPSRGSFPPSFPSGTFAELRSPDGHVFAGTFTFGGADSAAQPQLPNQFPSSAGGQPLLRNLSGGGGVRDYRALFQTLPSGDRLVLAIPLTDVNSTLAELLVSEGLISAAVLTALLVFAWWVVGLGLRPLERMGATAQAIAGGQFGRRVEPATPQTEIGRLGLALNGMLSQIEAALEQRSQSEQRLRRFVADASHELRTPLTSIRGYSELLRRGAVASPQDAAIAHRRIEAESLRMSSLVEDLLLMARLDQGRPLEEAPLDLRRIAEDACQDARAVAPERSVSLSAPEPVQIVGDDTRLRQAVSNLLRNAISHTPAGTGIEVSLDQLDGRAILSVRDHGPGLTPDAAARAFEPFYRADPARSRDRGGAGLGLAIAAGVVNAHGGSLRHLPAEGGGATFVMELPLTAEKPTKQQAEQPLEQVQPLGSKELAPPA
ncbi:MAG: HAMP domain-containing histidine kinase [Candidatus Dormibacteraeota bacterium]|nr:HAMP domain-containing histidine kinase [Candidatus Dormibacteraeota bacterium]